MAKADWDIYGTNYATSILQSVSPTHGWTGVGVPTFGETRFLYNGNTSLTNVRLVAQIRNNGAGDWLQFLTRWNSINPPVNGYRYMFHPWELTNPAYFDYLSLALKRYNSGVETLLFTAAVPLTSARNTWHKIRLSVTTEYSEVLLRLERWSGAAWVMLYEFRDPSPNRIIASGRAGFGMERCQTSNVSFFDDVNVISLA